LAIIDTLGKNVASKAEQLIPMLLGWLNNNQVNRTPILLTIVAALSGNTNSANYIIKEILPFVSKELGSIPSSKEVRSLLHLLVMSN
jgi:hypothetical protein